jgi:hypothetical protein
MSTPHLRHIGNDESPVSFCSTADSTTSARQVGPSWPLAQPVMATGTSQRAAQCTPSSGAATDTHGTERAAMLRSVLQRLAPVLRSGAQHGLRGARFGLWHIRAHAAQPAAGSIFAILPGWRGAAASSSQQQPTHAAAMLTRERRRSLPTPQCKHHRRPRHSRPGRQPACRCSSHSAPGKLFSHACTPAMHVHQPCMYTSHAQPAPTCAYEHANPVAHAAAGAVAVAGRVGSEGGLHLAQLSGVGIPHQAAPVLRIAVVVGILEVLGYRVDEPVGVAKGGGHVGACRGCSE